MSSGANDPTVRRAASLLTRVIGLLAASVVLEVVVQSLPPYYSPIRDSESALAVGLYGPLEVVSLCLRGGLAFLLLRAAALLVPREAISMAGSFLFGAAAASKFVIAFVRTDLAPRPETIHGNVHAVFAFASFFAASIGEILIARKLLTVSWLPAALLLRLAVITLAWSVVITVTVGLRVGIWGLLERVETALLLGWIGVYAVALRQRTLAPATDGSPS